MKVLIVNTSEKTGGAAVAANRLMTSLNNYGVKAKMLVRDKQTQDISVVGLKGKLSKRWYFLWERFVVFCQLHFKREHLFEIDLANAGTDITRLPEFEEADIIHLHWINQGFLSLNVIGKILRSGKPVVWTMHDMWPATALCHLTLGCTNFRTGCMNCKYLPGGGSKHDLSARVWKHKQAMLEKGNITFVTCSKWLEQEAKSSALLQGQTITSIPNPIDVNTFSPGSREEACVAEGLPTDKRLILFVCQRATNPNKGMQYLVDACRKLADEKPEMKANTGVVILGGHADEVAQQLPFAAYPMGYVSDRQRIVRIYRAASMFVLPSLSENLPNTIMEAMACGVPCLGFRVGGIPEEIDHLKNGYVADYRSVDDLAKGIDWILNKADRALLSNEAVKKVHHHYATQQVMVRYIEVYQQVLAQKHLML
ncbi:glycosyltransferase family 4 protein [Prevotella sp. E13-17]|uniref:glycosyltransferase family 4 protein n=1 Tax=Prevotella sp. E13-17 TaxID=2913616 RepID=UPI001EDAF06E|nr:glycosyltransferase family 4 protein [Prevotella sp. E13-17]UKK50527.1 glycosyltransferase family 4 protein [Prevotella sp. E13-17]